MKQNSRPLRRYAPAMQLFPLLRLLDARVTAETTKIHVATSNGIEHPIDVYVAGRFDEWQRWQNKRNFERDYVLSLIQIRNSPNWLFAGVYESTDREWMEAEREHYYHLRELTSFSELNGRLIVRFERRGRQSYLDAERWADMLEVHEVRAVRLAIAEFPGYRSVLLSREQLEIVTKQGLESWRSALSSVAGVYLISDTRTGKLYVGSASGEGGIWSRWCNYGETKHGGNVELKQLLRDEGDERAACFQFSILEIADIHESAEDILTRESHWKTVLLTREHGWNSN